MAKKVKRFVVANVDDGGKIVVQRNSFRTNWDDETLVKDVQVRKMYDGWHLLIDAQLKNNSSLAMRTRVEFTREGELEVLANAATETCTGNPCGHCEFAATGGCKCTEITGRCNHTISHLEPEEFPFFLLKA